MTVTAMYACAGTKDALERKFEFHRPPSGDVRDLPSFSIVVAGWLPNEVLKLWDTHKSLKTLVNDAVRP